LTQFGHFLIRLPAASLRSENCPLSRNAVRLKSESVFDFVGIRSCVSLRAGAGVLPRFTSVDRVRFGWRVSLILAISWIVIGKPASASRSSSVTGVVVAVLASQSQANPSTRATAQPSWLGGPLSSKLVPTCRRRVRRWTSAAQRFPQVERWLLGLLVARTVG
jgi:hypothetical protein